MKPLFVYYLPCGICRKAAEWFAEHGIEVEACDVVSDKPSADGLRRWIPMNGLPVRKFFNTSGLLYKEMELKEG